jgi:cytochrome c-type biogenesis protein CcmE
MPKKKPWKNRTISLLIFLVFFGAATFITLRVFEENIVFFYSPSELLERKLYNQEIRLGGLIREGTLIYLPDGSVNFVIEDLKASIMVHYQGPIPALIKEGQGAVAQGQLSSHGVFQAHELLAKHDENYMPKEVSDSIKKQGTWKGKETQSYEDINKPPYDIFE